MQRVPPNARPSTAPTPLLLLQTVPLSQAIDAAKPLTKQTIDKGKVWQYFIGSAVTLFLGTIALENYEGWFPAISRANKAMMANKTNNQQVGGRLVTPPADAHSSCQRSSWGRGVYGPSISLRSDKQQQALLLLGV
jgi:hypothetical protein